MDGQSITPDKIKQEQLKELFPEVFSEGKIDWEKLKATLGEDITFSNERYVLNWAGKSDAFKVLQAPTTKTLIPAKDESINFDETENIFIEGENLEVLKVLQKSYFGKIKMIYIDPPYNTGSDSFIYPDKFSETKEEYLKRVGDKDEEGYMTKDGMFKKNSKENGQYHSNWLNMMYPRLFLAKNLLNEEGVIFISIDDNELHNLRLLMNEVYGEENFVGQLTIINNLKGRNDKKNVATCHEYLLIYQKINFTSNGLPLTDEQKKAYKYVDEKGKKYALRDLRKRGRPDRREDRPNMYFPIYFNLQTNKCSLVRLSQDEIEIFPKRGDLTDGRWRWGIDRVRENIEFIHPKYSKKKNRWDIEHRVYLDEPFVEEDEEETENTIEYIEDEINEIDENDQEESIERTSKSKSFWIGGELSTDVGRRQFKKLFKDVSFDYPKTIDFIKRTVFMGSSPNDIILDFFAGSGTTANSILDLNKELGLNRKFICVQLPEHTDEKSSNFKAGYKTIADIAKERIRRVIGKIIEEKETLGKETATLMEKVAELQQQIEELKKNQPASMFNDGKQSPEIEKLIRQQETTRDKANENIEKMDKIDQCDKGFKVLKLNDSNFKQWQQIEGKDTKALEEQMKLFIDPVAENATIENMVYELLLKSGKDLNCKIEQATNYFKINENELVFMLEKATQEIIDAVLKEKPLKVVALDKLFKGNDQLKTNTVLQMKDAGIEFKTI